MGVSAGAYARAAGSSKRAITTLPSGAFPLTQLPAGKYFVCAAVPDVAYKAGDAPVVESVGGGSDDAVDAGQEGGCPGERSRQPVVSSERQTSKGGGTVVPSG